jgi:hypothetical protein
MASLDCAWGYSPEEVKTIDATSGSNTLWNWVGSSGTVFMANYFACGAEVLSPAEYNPFMVQKLLALRAGPNDETAPQGEEEFFAWLNAE